MVSGVANAKSPVTPVQSKLLLWTPITRSSPFPHLEDNCVEFFFHRKSQRFASGGRAGQLLLNTKGGKQAFCGRRVTSCCVGIASALAPWFGQKDTVVHSGEGPIYAIAWRSSLIAWANDVGIKIYDCATNQRITYIDRPKVEN